MAEWSFDTHDGQAARRARREFAQRVAGRFGDAVDAGVAELVLGELIGNVVRYAPGIAHVEADFDDGGVTIAVRDTGRGFAAPESAQEISPLSESGRGLAIIARLAETVEIDCAATDGCCVRARLDVRPR
jgi:anti-sigma regulatory factor (Ser/Thr protein kinase)